MPRLRRWTLLALPAVALTLGACSSAPPAPKAAPTTQPAPTTTSTTANPNLVVTIPAADRSPAGSSGTAPTVVVPAGTPPTQLESADLIPGSGPGAQAGDSLTVQYVLATYSTRGVVQSSWTSNPLTFALGEHQVISGWDMGLVGMQAGGRRELIIPPALGYADKSPGPGIAKNDTLIFVVDLLSIN